MIDQHTDLFKYVDNFSKTAHIPSISIIESKVDYIPEITIAIPTYKRTDLLKEAIDSAINQIDYTNYDIIVVDNNPERDCDTEKLMKSYNNPIISYYKNSENLGMGGNWNRLFTLAKGKYVVMLHDDDLLMPTFLAECIRLIKKMDADLIKPLAFNVRKNENYIGLNDDKKIFRVKRVFDISNYYSSAIGAPTGCLLKKDSVLKLGGFNDNYYPTMDYCFFVLFSKYYKCYKIFKKLYIYRIHVNTSFQKTVLDQNIWNDYFLNKQILEKYYVNKKLIRELLSSKFQSVIKGYAKDWDKPNYNFDLTQLDLNQSSKSIGYLIYYPIRLYVFLLETLLKIKRWFFV
jgi:glycosyltransferase involved in cell wall biosynthesis